MQLPVKSLLNLRWQVWAIYLMCLGITYIRKCLIRILDDRRRLVRSDRLYPLYHVRYHIRVCDDDLLGLVTSKILELCQHLLRGTEIQRWLHISIVKALALHDDRPVYIILRIKEMHITGCDHWLVEHLSELHDPLVVSDQIVHGLWIPCIPRHEFIVAKRLYLKVVKPVDQSHYLLIRRIINYGTEQLSRLTGRAYYQTLSVFVDETHRHTRPSRKICKMRLRYEPVQIDSSYLVLCQDDSVICLILFDRIR